MTFTPIEGLFGGAIVGLSAAILLLANGDVLGASGIISSTALHPKKALSASSQYWKLVFLASFFLTGNGLLADRALASPLLQQTPVASALGYSLGGFLTGFGTKMSNGCTSGHGICGMGRLSKRSFAAVISFFVMAVVTVSLLSSSWVGPVTEILRSQEQPSFAVDTVGAFATAIVVIALLLHPVFDTKQDTATSVNDYRKLIPAGIAGALFAAGLYISGMVFPSKVFGFFDFASIADGTWDPTLAMVLCGALFVSWVSCQFVSEIASFSLGRKITCPLVAGGRFSIPTNTKIDFQLVGGAAIFGIGWGISGICPGPGALLVSLGYREVALFWLLPFLVGSYLAESFKARLDSRS
jgi:uncharacterized membrane protein YedE/YeeE